jgi:hypothetical protein
MKEGEGGLEALVGVVAVLLRQGEVVEEASLEPQSANAKKEWIHHKNNELEFVTI